MLSWELWHSSLHLHNRKQGMFCGCLWDKVSLYSLWHQTHCAAKKFVMIFLPLHHKGYDYRWEPPLYFFPLFPFSTNPNLQQTFLNCWAAYFIPQPTRKCLWGFWREEKEKKVRRRRTKENGLDKEHSVGDKTPMWRDGFGGFFRCSWNKKKAEKFLANF